MNKTMCPVSREQFAAKAPAMVPVGIAGQSLQGLRKEFSTGSLGWYGNGKVTIEVDGVQVQCQVGITITAIGSKELPK